MGVTRNDHLGIILSWCLVRCDNGHVYDVEPNEARACPICGSTVGEQCGVWSTERAGDPRRPTCAAANAGRGTSVALPVHGMQARRSLAGR